MPAAPPPQSTYRLPLQPGFGFADAAGAASYLAALGVTHAYLSPILQAAPRSTHGYDVVDHSRLSAGPHPNGPSPAASQDLTHDGQHALDTYTDLGVSETAQMRATAVTAAQ